MSDKWPSDKLESQMIFDAEYVAIQHGRQATREVASHVKALLSRVRELEQERDVLREQLNVATTRAQRFYDCLMRLAIRANDYGFLDIWANIADALKISVKELEQVLEAS